VSFSWAGVFHEWMELMQKDDSVLARATKAHDDSDGGNSRFS
jgi:hypothetical protein